MNELDEQIRQFLFSQSWICREIHKLKRQRKSERRDNALRELGVRSVALAHEIERFRDRLKGS